MLSFVFRMITANDVIDFIHLDNVTNVNVLFDNGLIFTSFPNWMYRAEDDVTMSAVMESLHFQYPANNRPGVLGLGGINFACSIDHVLGYARNKTQARPRHFFMCPMPPPVVTWQHYGEWERGPILQDTLARSVRSGDHVGDEFVKAGMYGHNFLPAVLILVRVSE